ncbi:cation diffusion facilitator family transporter [Actinospongicola halichondriae]|uniref:cation diffusion facilitator family transporter n=1 Tax=Actinospongicola halichondriae TaxID=3236844 RepID=UPI003D4EE019
MAAGGEGGTKAIVAALVANAGIAIAKFVGFLITGSSSMLAESVHSVADTSNQGLLLYGGNRAKRDATPQHPFGFGRERYFWSFIVALVLFTLGSGFAIYEGIEKIRHPHVIDSLGVAVGILLLGIVLEGYSFGTAIKIGRGMKGDAGWWEFIRRSRAPEVPVVLLEDAGAMTGLVLALAGVGLSEITGDPVWDGIGTLCIGLLLGLIAIVLAVEMKSLLMGESATVADQRAIRAAIEEHPAVDSLIHMRTQHLGPEELLVAAKIDFGDSLDMEDLATAVDDVERAIRASVTHTQVIYLEPDVRRAAGAPTP